MKDCLKCLLRPDLNHPFHDDGTVNEDADLEEFAMPDWHRGLGGKVTGNA